MKGSRGASIPYLLWIFIFTVLPMGLVVWFAFSTEDGSFTFTNISAVGAYAAVIFRSIWLAAIATALCLVIAYPLAYHISRTNPRHQKTYLMLVMLPMWMNFLLRTYAWMTLLENTGLINRLFAMVGL
ncbi:MAG: ABC transporter permease, partial [Oscillospiraceae bacterium]